MASNDAIQLKRPKLYYVEPPETDSMIDILSEGSRYLAELEQEVLRQERGLMIQQDESREREDREHARHLRGDE